MFIYMFEEAVDTDGTRDFKMVLLGVEKTDEFRWLEEPIED
jgi:hypothetical protein